MKRQMSVLLLAAAACGTTPAAGSDSSSGEPTPSGSTTTDATMSTTNVLPTDASSTTEVDETVGVSFITDPDGGRAPGCSLFEQDCPRGEKCNPWANDGGNAWNGTQCVPVDANPDGIGDPCSVQVTPLSGIDSCERGAMCWFIEVDIDGNGTGRCLPHCSGTLNAPTCEDPNSKCVYTDFLALCIPRCHPLAPDPCGAGQGCYPLDNRFDCQPDASGRNAGGIFEICEFANGCDPGSACMASDFVGLCESGVSDCCTPYCDTTAPTCPDGTQCIAYYEEGSTPLGYEDVGVCGQDPG